MRSSSGRRWAWCASTPSRAASDFEDPLILTAGRHGTTVESACRQLHRSLVESFDYAMVWGASVKHAPQRVDLSHALADEDVVQIVKKRTTAGDPNNEKKAREPVEGADQEGEEAAEDVIGGNHR